MITVDGLVKRFGKKREIAAVDGVSFRAADGAITGLLGPNGAGKTTLQRMLSTLVTPDTGHAAIGGLDVVRDRYRVRDGIGVLSDARGLYTRLTARENVRYFGRTQTAAITPDAALPDARQFISYRALGLAILRTRTERARLSVLRSGSGVSSSAWSERAPGASGIAPSLLVLTFSASSRSAMLVR